MPSVIFFGETLDGTDGGELIAGISGFGTNHTINAGGGNDLVLGEMDYFKTNYLGALNTSLGAAMSIDGSAWSTSTNNPLIGVAGPHTSVYIEPGAGEQRFFSVTVGANETLVADVDFGSGTDWGNTDVMVDILDADGNVLASNDDASSDFGSFSVLDSRLTYTPSVGGTYYIRVREFGSDDGNTFEGGEQILLNVSVTNHAASDAGAITAGNDTINGGDGNDTIVGMLGTDTVHGDAGNDFIVSTGDGSYFGDDGNDTIFAGLTNVSETIDGGAGVDLLDTTSWSGPYVVDLATGLTNYAGESFTNFENLRAGAGNDTLSGTGDGNIIYGGGGNDVVNALGGNDTLYGDAGDDTLNGGEGNDSLYGGPGVDALDGGDGDDLVVMNFANGAAAHGGAGVDTLYLHIFAAAGTIGLDMDSSQGADTMDTDGFENLDASQSIGNVTVYATVDANTITTGSGNDTIGGVLGADIIFSGAGDDLLSAYGGAFALDGGDGIDTYNGAVYLSGVEHYWSLGLGYHGFASFADPVVGTLTNIENFIGMQGDANEHVRGTNEANAIWGGDGDDLLRGRGGDDTLEGEDGFDRLLGDAGTDALVGGAGDDRLDGGVDADTMEGGLGNDTYYVDDAGDAVIEAVGEGTDKVFATIDFVLPDEVESLALKGLAKFGTGNDLANVIFGSSGKNTITGLGGADTLYGNAGFDTLIGGSGADDIYGGVGKDNMTGDADADQFVFLDGDTAAIRSGADIITDFNQAQGDLIKLKAMDADVTLAGDQKFQFIGTGAFTGTARELHYVHDGGHTFIEGDTDGDGLADFVIRLNGLINLTTGDFVL